MGTRQPPSTVDILPLPIETLFCVAWDLNVEAFGSWPVSWSVVGWSRPDPSFSKEGLLPSEANRILAFTAVKLDNYW